MSYIQKNLLNNEQIVHQGKIHWLFYQKTINIFGLMILLIYTYHWIFTNQKVPIDFLTSLDRFWGKYLAIAIVGLFFYGIYSFVRTYIKKRTTELAVTNQRVIAKFGFISRDTLELSHKQIEGITVKQTMIERMLNCGTIIINGTGGGVTPIPKINDPLNFRKKALEAGV